MYAFGCAIDSAVNGLSCCLACCAYCGSLSRSGPMFPFASGPAGVYVWHEPQPWAAKIALPGDSFATVPTTVFGVGVLTPWLPQPASANAAAAQTAVRAAPRIGRESTASNRSRAKQPSVPSRMTSTGVSFTRRETTTASSIASTLAYRGLLAAIHTSTAAQPRKRAAEYHARVTEAHERWTRRSKSPNSEPLPTECVTWL